MSLDAHSTARTGAPDASGIATFRSHTWLTLGGLFRHPPDAAFLERIGRSAGAAAGEGELACAWSALAEAAAGARIEPLDDEFHDLFIGLGRGEVVPYASWYRSGFLMDRPLVALRRDLRLLGFERQPEVREPEDHAAALCEVMGLLADPAEGQDDATQRLFFTEHVDSWMPQLCADLAVARSADFYRVVGRLGVAFLDFERGWLGAEAPAGTGPQQWRSES